MRTIALTSAALAGFAANSLLCRAALAGGSIDPATFTLVRLVSGAVALSLLARRQAESVPVVRDVRASFALFAYAILFSFAYVRLRTGPGALLLFGAVQITMIAAAMRAGERSRLGVWIGLLLAIAGLAALTVRSGAPTDRLGALSMVAAGASWGAYSLRGRASRAPLHTTARNFAWSVPMAFFVELCFLRSAHATTRGIALAVASGALASGVGYTLWYAALPSLTATRAAIVQLSVPVIAALAGVVLLGEPITARVVVAGSTILVGVGWALRARAR